MAASDYALNFFKNRERTLRRLLIIGSSAVVQQASKRGAPTGTWLE